MTDTGHRLEACATFAGPRRIQNNNIFYLNSGLGTSFAPLTNIITRVMPPLLLFLFSGWRFLRTEAQPAFSPSIASSGEGAPGNGSECGSVKGGQASRLSLALRYRPVRAGRMPAAPVPESPCAGQEPGLARKPKFQRNDCANETAKPWLSLIYNPFSALPASPRENELSLKLERIPVRVRTPGQRFLGLHGARWAAHP